MSKDSFEAEWARQMISAAESVAVRKKVAGALSVTQFRGAKDYWSYLKTQLRRRVAEKAYCKILELGNIPRQALDLRQKCLAQLAQCLALDKPLQVLTRPR
eukprot:CAMPEP_0113675176 /NCGR_PEP_ID=MMETSP0038_2-20120614/7858_1 /TAXON_ID=2898 /ORGANISM="Cryptomonas paramecium" /LENGTH=100 /DNA_ID=CAMNT_0000591897 /DNA_START=249 /DNA_END=551 /DNA_ORIENTATION=- /assembly_acc=CAM_ASM_000170